MTQATDLLRRSFCYRRLDALGANYAEINRGAAPLDFGDAEAETEAAKAMALADLSMLPRTGFKGSGTPEWLADQGVKVPEESNRTTRQEGGALAARLAPAELLILGDESGDGALIDKLNAAWWAEPRPPETPRGSAATRLAAPSDRSPSPSPPPRRPASAPSPARLSRPAARSSSPP